MDCVKNVNPRYAMGLSFGGIAVKSLSIAPIPRCDSLLVPARCRGEGAVKLMPNAPDWQGGWIRKECAASDAASAGILAVKARANLSARQRTVSGAASVPPLVSRSPASRRLGNRARPPGGSHPAETGAVSKKPASSFPPYQRRAFRIIATASTVGNELSAGMPITWPNGFAQLVLSEVPLQLVSVSGELHRPRALRMDASELARRGSRAESVRMVRRARRLFLRREEGVMRVYPNRPTSRM